MSKNQPKESSLPATFTVSQRFIQAVNNYCASRPYAEVYQLMGLLTQEVAPQIQLHSNAQPAELKAVANSDQPQTETSNAQEKPAKRQKARSAQNPA